MLKHCDRGTTQKWSKCGPPLRGWTLVGCDFVARRLHAFGHARSSLLVSLHNCPAKLIMLLFARSLVHQKGNAYSHPTSLTLTRPTEIFAWINTGNFSLSLVLQITNRPSFDF